MRTNTPDATLRNVRAAQKRLDQLEARVDELAELLRMLITAWTRGAGGR